MGVRMAGYVALGAVALIAVVALTARALRSRSATPAPVPAGLVGTLGTVVTQSPDEGVGAVTVKTDGERLKLEARAETAIRPGATVVVVDADPSTLVVAESGF